MPEYWSNTAGSVRTLEPFGLPKWLTWAPLEGLDAGLCFVDVAYEDGTEAKYFISTAVSFGEKAESVRSTVPNAVLSPIRGRDGDGVLHDGLLDDECLCKSLRLIQDGGELHTRHGVLRGLPGAALVKSKTGLDALDDSTAFGQSEQRGSSTSRSAKFTLKLFCRNEPGNNPESRDRTTT